MKNKKMNNKGFSLVELIIVIAIMAVLVAVLAPQYMRFVERGRVASDNDNILAIESAMQVHSVDTMATEHFSGTSTITLNRNADASSSGSTDAILEALRNAGLIGSTDPITALPRLTNQQNFSQAVITITVNSTTGAINVNTATSTPATP